MGMKGRIIKNGKAEGEAIVSREPIGFFGGVDPETGKIDVYRIKDRQPKESAPE